MPEGRKCFVYCGDAACDCGKGPPGGAAGGPPPGHWGRFAPPVAARLWAVPVAYRGAGQAEVGYRLELADSAAEAEESVRETRRSGGKAEAAIWRRTPDDPRMVRTARWPWVEAEAPPV